MYVNKMDHKSALCIQSFRPSQTTTNIPSVQNFDFGGALESVYPLLEIIFNYLNCEELKVVSHVKRTWKIIADKILEKRVAPSWITCNTKIEYSDNFHNTNAALGIFMYNPRKCGSRNGSICVHSNKTDYSLKKVPAYIAGEVVPENTDYCILSCPKVISWFNSDNKDFKRGSIFDGIFIPVLPNVRSTMFHCKPKKVKNVEQFIKPNEEIKCLLLFCKDSHCGIDKLFDKILPERNYQSVAVGGGIIRSSQLFKQISFRNFLMVSRDEVLCIAFLQDNTKENNFDAFSIVIEGDDLSNEEFEDHLKIFRDKTVLRNYSVAFRICCSAKFDPEEELTLFSKVFPNVPLLGLNADGEIGWNSFQEHHSKDFEVPRLKKSKQAQPNMHHQWSTVLVLLTWGQLQTK